MTQIISPCGNGNTIPEIHFFPMQLAGHSEHLIIISVSDYQTKHAHNALKSNSFLYFLVNLDDGRRTSSQVLRL